MYALGIDLGTSYTAAAVWRRTGAAGAGAGAAPGAGAAAGHAEVVALGSRAPVVPSVVVLREDGTMLTGEAAERRSLVEPHRVAREFKRRLGDPVPILLDRTPCSPEQLSATMLGAVIEAVSAAEGGPPAQVCLSHPASWGPHKKDLLRQVVRLSNLDRPTTFTTEPEAAATWYATQQRVEQGATVAVYDLGGGTFDAAILRRTATGFEILGQPEGVESLGGSDFDAAVFAHVRHALRDRLAELDEEDPAALSGLARLRADCVAAKEALSADTDVSVPVQLRTPAAGPGRRSGRGGPAPSAPPAAPRA